MATAGTACDNVEMGVKFKTFLQFLVRPRTSLFLVALFNFIWFFSGSSIVYHFDSDAITFCAICPWWWDWSLTNAPSLSLFASIFLLFSQRLSFLAAMTFSGFSLVNGISWVSSGQGLSAGLSQRYQIIYESSWLNIWELLDLQYLLAAIIFIAAAIYLVNASVAKKRSPS